MLMLSVNTLIMLHISFAICNCESRYVYSCLDDYNVPTFVSCIMKAFVSNIKIQFIIVMCLIL